MIFRALLASAFALAAVAAHADDSAQIARGRYLAIEGDCVVCHTRQDAGSPQYAGGYPLHAEPGTVFSSNITPDKDTGIGKWDADQFYRALHDGIAPGGRHLYPAFPYAYFSSLSRTDGDAIFAYLKTIKPVHYRPPHSDLIFPANVRTGMAFWNALYLSKKPFQSDKTKSTQWNRGAEIVTGIGHCGACHSPKNFLFADKPGTAMQGNVVDGWYAPNITGAKRDGLGDWSAQDIVQFLKTGRNAHAWVAGSMLPVVEDSTSQMTDSDLAAIAIYLKSYPAVAETKPPMPDAKQMAAGQAVFVARCTVCHTQTSAQGYPTLVSNTLVQGRDPSTVLRIILQGAQSAKTVNKPAAFSMPAFPVLSDQELADVATYIRNSWGNRANPVSAGDVKTFRKSLAATN